jgi:NitT/TauT family transport system substrate-binding protein
MKRISQPGPLSKGLLLAACILALVRPATAELAELNVSQGTGLTYLPMFIVAESKLIEKHAAAAGMPDLKVNFSKMGSGTASAEMLLSGSADIVAGGQGALINLWDKTRGRQKVRGIVAICDSPIVFLTTNPKIRSVRDFTPDDRIAVTAIKVSTPAVALQMAAAKEFGHAERNKLDQLTVALPALDSQIALLTNATEVKTFGSYMPFTAELLESGKVHTVFSSFDITGPGNLSSLYTTEEFRSRNPKLYKAILAAFEEAAEFISANKDEAARIYVKYEPQKRGWQWIRKILDDESLIKFTTTPHAFQAFADFMYEQGTIKNRASSWRELFWEDIHDKPGT